LHPLDVSANDTNAGLTTGEFDLHQVSNWQPWYDIMDSDESVHVCPDLAWSQVFPSSSYHQHNINFSLIPYYDLDDDTDSVLESSIDFISDNQPLSSTSIDPTSKYLYALNLHISEMKSDRTQFYADLLHNNEQSLQAHMDARSITSTTN